MPAINTFLKENVPRAAKAVGGAAGIGNILFLPGYIKDLATAENKMKAIVKITADWFFWTMKLLAPLRGMFIAGGVIAGFQAMQNAIRNIVRDTGSLAAALTKLQQIQLTERQLSPFVGGLANAKNRVAELLALSARGPFQFSELADANKSLEIFTRGAYSSAEATRTIGIAAITSGNQIGDVATAVGGLYQSLRGGSAIQASAEQLRQLGVISGQTSEELVEMQKDGASTAEVFDRLTTEMESSRKAFTGVKDDLASVTAEHEKAAEALKEKFGAPWTASEITNTKNMTAAMQAIAPAVGRVSESLATAFGGMGTMRSEVIKFVASSAPARNVMESLAKGAGQLAVVLTTAATVALPLMIGKLPAMVAGLTSAEFAASGLGIALTVALGATAIGIAVAGLTVLTGIGVQMVHQHREATRELNRMEKAFRTANQAIKEQIGTASTLAQRNEALANSMNQVIAAEDRLRKARAAGKAGREAPEGATAIAVGLAAPPVAAVSGIAKAFSSIVPTREERQAQAQLKEARKTFDQGIRSFTPGLKSPERDRMMEEAIKRQQEMEEARFEAVQATGTPEARIAATRERAGTLLQRGAAGQAAIAAAVPTAERVEVLAEKRKRPEAARAAAAAELEEVTREAPGAAGRVTGTGIDRSREDRMRILNQRIKEADKSMADFDRRMLEARLGAPASSSVRQFAEAENIQLKIEAGVKAEVAARKDATAETKRQAKVALEAAGGVALGPAEREKAQAQRNAAEQEGKRLQMLEQQSAELIKQGIILQAQAQEEQRMFELEKSRAHTNLQIASATGGTETVARKVFDLSQRQLDTEIASEKAKKPPDPKVLAQIQAQLDAKQKEIDLETRHPGGARSSVMAELQLEKQKLEIAKTQEQVKSGPNTVVIEELQARKEEARIAEHDRRIEDASAKSQIALQGRIASLKGTSQQVELQVIDQQKLQTMRDIMMETMKARPDAGRIKALQTRMIELDIAKKNLAIDQSATAARQESEKQIAGLKGNEAQRAAQTYNITKKSIADQITFEKSRPHPNEEAIKALEIQGQQADQAETERTRSMAVTRTEADIELKRRRAAQQGRSEEAIGLKDQEEFIQRFEGHRKEGMQDEEARQRATEETQETITEEATKRGGLPVVASQLARIGGGGGVYAPGGDPNTTILKRTQELTRKSNEYLKTVADAVAKGGGID